MRDRIFLGLYLLWVVLLTSIHDVRFLGTAVVAVLLLSGRRAPGLLRRALGTFLWFNLAVTLAYLLSTLVRGNTSWSFVALINLRVAALTFSAFWITSRINILSALSFSPTLVYLLTIAYSQIITLRRVLLNSREALRSRTLGPLGFGDLYRHRAGVGAFLFGRGLRDATEITQAMRSRGFFDDHR